MRRTVCSCFSLLLIVDLLCTAALSLPLLIVNESRHFGDLSGSGGADDGGGGSVTGSNSTNSSSSFADMFDRALQKEFTENEQNEATDSGSFNNSVAEQQGFLCGSPFEWQDIVLCRCLLSILSTTSIEEHMNMTSSEPSTVLRKSD